MKVCSKCNELKFKTDFYGGSSMCKPCKNKYKTEQRIEKKKKLIEENGGSCKECNHEFDGKNESSFTFYSDNNKFNIKSNIDLSYDKLLVESKKQSLLCNDCKRKK